MTLDDLERQNRGFYGFFWALSAWTSLYHSQGGAMVLAFVAWRSCSRVLAETKLLYAGPG